MKAKEYYSSGQFAKMAHITKKTIRYYDEHGILKPSFVNERGARFYTDDDLAKLQQILLFKYLGFSLDDIKEMTINGSDHHFLKDSLKMQEKLIDDKILQLELMKKIIHNSLKTVDKEQDVDWPSLFMQINLDNMEKSMKNQYKNARNISARICLHNDYSSNKTGWFPWVFDILDIKAGHNILEIGCGDGSLWSENKSKLPDDIHILVSDISKGMVKDASKKIGENDTRFSFKVFECQDICADDNSFDTVIAGHVLFYCDDLNKVCSEVNRVLKPGGTFVCSTYGNMHMKEVSRLVGEFDDRIVLAADNLYNKFGKENGADILNMYFESTRWIQYEDSLMVDNPEPLIAYILSCHGNQNQFLIDKYKEFKAFVKKKTEKGYHITKDAGVFVAKKAL